MMHGAYNVKFIRYIYGTWNCITSRTNTFVYVTLKLLDINKAVNCNFKSTNTMFYCKSAGRQSMMSPHDIHKSLFPRTSRTILGPTSNSIQWGVFVHVHLVWRLRMYGVIPKLPPPHILSHPSRGKPSSK